jgi:quinol monooxygenase YgiN
MEVVRINYFESAPGKSGELYGFLNYLKAYISASEGCHSCELLRSGDSDNNFVVIEKWESSEYHQKSLENFPQERMEEARTLFNSSPSGHYYYY